jgi:hypothetical protein
MSTSNTLGQKQMIDWYPRQRGAKTPWWSSAWKMWEIGLVAPQVVAHRTARMATAGVNPTEHDRREFALMSQEKLDAFTESWTVMATQMTQYNMQLFASAGERVLKATFQWPLALTWPVTGVPRAAQQAWSVPDVLNGAHFADAMSQTFDKALRPVHRRVTANAARLGRDA